MAKEGDNRGGARPGAGRKKGSKQTTPKPENDKRGGAREGSGRPKGARQTLTKKAREAARLTGKLPHEILLDAARGECFKIKREVIEYYESGPMRGQEKCRKWIDDYYWPDYSERIDAAKAAAPYYAPKLAIKADGSSDLGKQLLEAFQLADNKVSDIVRPMTFDVDPEDD